MMNTSIDTWAKLDTYLDRRCEFAFDASNDERMAEGRRPQRIATEFGYLNQHLSRMAVANMTSRFANELYRDQEAYDRFQQRVAHGLQDWRRLTERFRPAVPDVAEVPPSSRYVDGYRWRDCKSAKDCKRKR